MERVKIAVSQRNERGKGPAGRLKRSGSVPAVLYGQNAHMSLTVPVESMKALRSMHFSESAIVDMEISGEKEPIPVLIKDMQYNPLNEEVTHIDFFKVSLTEKIRVRVPVVLKGEAPGTKDAGGILNHVLRELEVEGLPLEIPARIEVDVSLLNLGNSIHVGDLQVTGNVRVLSDASETVVTVVAKQEEAVPVEPLAGAVPQEPEVIKEKKETDEEAEEGKPAPEGKKEKEKEKDKDKDKDKGKEKDKKEKKEKS
ncbi:MAG: hypothetical protein A3K83_03330 [Omnitrophica WOR_2 bacterium RBG_13_44_8b]|nr:MAG: hypothetical protein A3K83_03330 [Omnitrophica WOR_2 bacterium RBG_13_44_8b]